MREVAKKVNDEKISAVKLETETRKSTELNCDSRGLPYTDKDEEKNKRLQEVRELVRQERSHGIVKK